MDLRGFAQPFVMKVMPELRPKLFADAIELQAHPIATLRGPIYEICEKIPAASLRQSILDRLCLFGKNLVGCSLETLTMLQDHALEARCLR
jgi:hypothetical protein